jgi:hypothetical protein
MADSVFIGRVSFSPGFSDGFETQNRLLLSAVYNINIPLVSGGVTSSINVSALPQNLSATYSIIPTSIIEGSGLLTSANILSAIYNLTDPQIKAYVTIPVSIISASYQLNIPQILNSSVIIPEILSATYNSEGVNVRGSSNTLSDIIDVNYQLLSPTLSIATTATGSSLNATYTIEDINNIVEVNYTLSANVISGAYNLNNPEVIIAIPEWFNCPQVPFNDYWKDDTECRDNERDLYDTLITDTYNKFASVWVYYPTTYNITYDRVFKEDQNKFVIRAFSAMGFIEDIPPEHKTWQLEGIIGMDIVRAYFSIDHFTEASTFSGITSGIYESYQPTVGDICYLTPNDVFYEVINVKTTVEQFMNRAHNYELVLRVFRDNKMTVSANSPTLPSTDPIYTVCTSAISATEQFSDYLSINTKVGELFSAIEYVPKPGEHLSDSFGGW